MNKEIPIFYAVDDKFIPLLAVSLSSLVSNTKKIYNYSIKILTDEKISEENIKKIKKYESDNISIQFIDLSKELEQIKDKLYTRNYYSNTTYFRLFIPELYTQYDKVIYIDSDTVILDDIAKLYNKEIGNNLIAGVPDGVIQTIEVFQDYVEKVVGMADYNNYFNAGIIVMNLKELRKFKFQEKFLYLLEKIRFEVAQDQDYLNRLCKGRVKLLDSRWNTMPIMGERYKRPKIIHYNLGAKPWYFDNISYQEYFWEYAKKTEFYEYIKSLKDNYTEEDKQRDDANSTKLIELAQKEAECVGDDGLKRKRNRSNWIDIILFRKDKNDIQQENKEKSEYRKSVLKKIEKLEEEGKFDVDAENDPPTIVLTPENVDYLRKKMMSKIKRIFANEMGERFLDSILKNNKLIIKDVKGIENLQNIKTGAMITCNHFNPFDSFAVEKVFKLSGQSENKKLHKIIREGNYTNFPGLYGFFFRNCDTLPLSSSKKTMIEFIKAVDVILQRGDFILIYPEQSLWWNYRKPKPLKEGAFKLATRNNVPVIPIFITMEDSKIIGDDGFPVQEYTVNIDKPIYPQENLSQKENMEIMMQKNSEIWKNIYEDFYKIPLEYSTKTREKREINAK